MKKNDEKTKKRVCLGLLTHPLIAVMLSGQRVSTLLVSGMLEEKKGENLVYSDFLCTLAAQNVKHVRIWQK